jgi:hypothetical protein
MAADVKKAVCDAIQSKEFKNGIVTTQSLGEILKVHHEQIDILIAERLKALQTASTPNETATPTPVAEKESLDFAPGTIDDDEEAVTTRPIVYRTYSHSGRFWHTKNVCPTSKNEVGHWLEDLVPWNSLLSNKCR